MPASNVVIQVENLVKEYRLGTINHGTLYRDLQSWWARLRGHEDPNSLIGHHERSALNSQTSTSFLALNDVSFNVKQGDIVGIIGRNGAGKSTLLKILSQVTSPSSGMVKLKGRVASLLEVGTGFHPELTGRENIFLNGAILGMGKAEIGRKFDEIVAFAEIDKFIDTPVKRYSSGMYVRLAFAVAAHLEPEILIVDEVLAVGDAQFQKKCLGKMQEVGKEGRTVLFVSHNMTALKSLCSSAIWLNSGTVVEEGETDQVVSNYLQNTAVTVLEQVWEDQATAPGNDKVRLQRASLTPQTPDLNSVIDVTTPLKLTFVFWNFLSDAQLNFSMHLYNVEGLCIFNTGSKVFKASAGSIQGSCHIPGNFLNDGIYRVKIMIVQDQSIGLYEHHDVLIFEVHEVERAGGWFGKWAGVVRPLLQWETTSE